MAGLPFRDGAAGQFTGNGIGAEGAGIDVQQFHGLLLFVAALEPMDRV
jgi:hypothetical protein